MTMTLTSSAFEHEGIIPSRHTCEGEDISPLLRITGVPAGTKSLVLIADDPDAPDPAAPKMTYVHWVLYNLPPDTKEIPEGASAADLGARSGLNDWKREGYGGPCPPIGRHRYFFKLYALEEELPDLGAVTKKELEQRMQKSVLVETVLLGTYQKGDRP